MYFPGELHAQSRGKFSLFSACSHVDQLLTTTTHTGRKPRRKMRLRLGWHGILLLDSRLLLRPRDERTLLQRDRYPVQPPRTRSQVEKYSHRRSGRRVRCWSQLVAAEGVDILLQKSRKIVRQIQLRSSARTQLQSHTLEEIYEYAPSPAMFCLFFTLNMRYLPTRLHRSPAGLERALSVALCYCLYAGVGSITADEDSD
jgi:hypothetical protein